MSEATPARRRTRGGCLVRLLVLGALAAVIVFFAADHVFNLRSNLTYVAFRNSRQPLEARLAQDKWKTPGAMTPMEMDRALERQAEAGGVAWRVLTVRRKAEGAGQRTAQALLSSRVNVIEFAPGRFDFFTSFHEGFTLTTAAERAASGGLDFVITANFRDPKGKPLGLVVHEGRQRNAPFPNWTGYFFVKNGVPWFGPKSLFDETPGVLTEAAQGYPSLMKSHTVFPYVDLAPTKFFDGDKVAYRALAGTRQNGTVVFILSGNGGVMNVTEVSALAQKLNVQHATLLDGGRALQYVLRIAGRELRFAAFNTTLDIPWRALERQRSPVFIGALARREDPAGLTR